MVGLPDSESDSEKTKHGTRNVCSSALYTCLPFMVFLCAAALPSYYEVFQMMHPSLETWRGDGTWRHHPEKECREERKKVKEEWTKQGRVKVWSEAVQWTFDSTRGSEAVFDGFGWPSARHNVSSAVTCVFVFTASRHAGIGTWICKSLSCSGWSASFNSGALWSGLGL